MALPVKEASTPNKPVLTKTTFASLNDLYEVGSSCMQGWRKQMEDSHTHILSLLGDHQTSFFAVYDGHGGDKVATYAGENLHWYITKRPEYKKDNIPEAMKNGFLDLDAAMKDFIAELAVGSTANVIIIKDKMLYCGNIGDSRAIAGIDGSYKVLSLDHKPSKIKERQRIRAAGGFVTLNRVNGKLATSRAFGDFQFKKSKKVSGPEEQIVTACPDIMIKEIDSTWEFIVMASDGIWDVLNSEDVYKFVHERMGAGVKPNTICNELMDVCFALGSKDNMTVIIVHLLNVEGKHKNHCQIGGVLDDRNIKMEPNQESPIPNAGKENRRSKLNSTNLPLNEEILVNKKRSISNFIYKEENSSRIPSLMDLDVGFPFPSLMDLNVPCPPKFNKEKRRKKNLSSIPSLLDLKVSNPFERNSFCHKPKNSSGLPPLVNFTISLPLKPSLTRNRKEGLD